MERDVVSPQPQWIRQSEYVCVCFQNAESIVTLKKNYNNNTCSLLQI